MDIDNALIIDDEIDICILLRNFLKKKSRTVDFSTSLKDGFTKFKIMNPDLLILDHNLPDGHGIETIKEFRKLNNSLYIIVISAMSNLKNKALENGADFFMEKPISFSRLKEILSK